MDYSAYRSSTPGWSHTLTGNREQFDANLRRRLEALRAPPKPPEDLHPLTFKWLASLPPKQRPQALPRQYPRIANRLAYLWKRRQQCERYLDELAVDQRGSRRGFPAEVAREIGALKLLYVAQNPPVERDVWSDHPWRNG